MSKFLKSLTDGSLRCKFCGDRECSCMEDGRTKLEIVAVWHQTDKATLVQLRRQKLINGKKIPSGVKVWIPNYFIYGIDTVLKTMVVDNVHINKMIFD